MANPNCWDACLETEWVAPTNAALKGRDGVSSLVPSKELGRYGPANEDT